MSTTQPGLDDVRAIALGLDGAHEVETWGHPTFRLRGKMFASVDVEGTVAGVKMSLEAQQALVASDPHTYGVEPHLGRHGWTTVRLAAVSRQELLELITDAWAAVAGEASGRRS